ncbi:MAG TPA: metallophosphoesterase [Vicinamibacterales bacterium]|nr:metallophosphoesterase [Vicinamibacterales bacterium]
MRTSRHIRLAGLLITFLTATLVVAAQDVTLPRKQSTLKFAVIGDTGTGDSNQYRVAKVLAAARQTFPFEFVVMVGDNMYGADNPRDYEKKFEIPYKPILDAGVKFYAALGNHDSPNQKQYKLFNMNGQRFYTFKPKDGVRFFALDSNYMDPEQLQWAEKELKASGSDWKIAFFHHPLYSSGERHGSDTAMKDQLEPLFQRYSVDVVLTGHDHVYERIKPQKGIQYFVVGNSAKVRKGDLEEIGLTAKGFDTGYGFMLVELDGDQFHFQVISDAGKTIDSGTVVRNRQPNAPANAAPDTVTVPKPPAKK